jgi:hypothetical protein
VEKITLNRSAPFLHPKLGKGDILTLKWTRVNNYGQEMYIYESKYGNQYLYRHEFEQVTGVKMKYPEKAEKEPKASEKQIAGNHYKKLKIQPMQYNLANNMNYAQANAIKYITRYKDKNGIEDLKKAIHCLELLIEFETQIVEDERSES